MKKIFQQPSGSIDRLLQHSRYLEYLTKRILTYLPDEFSGKISVLGFSTYNKPTYNESTSTRKNEKQQTLMISTSSAAWASKLRFYIPTLKRSLASEPQFSQLKKISVKVAATNISIIKEKKMPLYSQNAANIIQSSAEFIENDELKDALIRLAGHVGNS